MTDNTKMREALIKFGDENPSLDLDFRLHTHGKYLTQEKAIVASRAFKAGAAWQAARTVPEGFVMVPVEPTEKMLKAGERGIGVSSYVRKGMTIREYRFFKSGWEAMLAAAAEEGAAP